MRKGKLIAGIIWLVVAAMLIMGLISLIQRLLISGTEFMNGLGGMLVEEQEAVQPSAEPTILMTEDDFNDSEPIATMEPEELFSIPVEETAEELAKENEKE